MLTNLIIGAALIAATVVVQTVGLILPSRIIAKLVRWFRLHRHGLLRILAMMATVLGLFVIHGCEVWLWALALVTVGASHTFEEALYLSTPSFSTLGADGGIAAHSWRLLVALELIDGLVLIGWSIAYLVGASTRRHLSRGRALLTPQTTPTPKPSTDARYESVTKILSPSEPNSAHACGVFGIRRFCGPAKTELLARARSRSGNVALDGKLELIGGNSVTDFKSELDRLQIAYKAAVEEWIAAIKHEEALASVTHSVAEVDDRENAHFAEDDIRGKVKSAKKHYEDALRKKFFNF